MTDWIANGEAGSSVRGKLNVFHDELTGSEELSSGAAPVNADNSKYLTVITSGGTAGNEHVILPDFAEDANDVAPDKTGRQHTVYLKTQTNPSDIVLVFSRSVGTTTRIRDNAGTTIAEINGGVVLDYEGATATFVWYNEVWYLIRPDQNDDSTLENKQLYMPDPSGGAYAKLLFSNAGNPAEWDGFPVPLLYENVITGAAPVQLNHEVYTSDITTGGTAGTEQVNIISQVPSVVGMRHVVVLQTKTNPADIISLGITNVRGSAGEALTSIIFSNNDEWLLIEWWDTVWRVVRSTAVVTPV